MEDYYCVQKLHHGSYKCGCVHEVRVLCNVWDFFLAANSYTIQVFFTTIIMTMCSNLLLLWGGLSAILRL